MANQWFRMYSDFLNDPKMISLAFEDQRHFIGILALKSDGTLDQQCDKKLLDRIIAQRLWIDYAILDEVKKRLVNAGLIDDSWQPLAWEKRQFVSDNSSERVRRFREKKAAVTSNVSETLQKRPQITDTDTDTDTESNNTNVLFVDSDAADDKQASPDKPDNCPHQEILDLYHRVLPACPRIRDWTPARAQALRARWRENPEHRSLKYWEALFRYIANCPFLVGRGSGNRPFFASLEWICKAENFAKIREGRYEPV